jgi:hypothetical protein
MAQPQMLHITSGLGAAVGIAIDDRNNKLYFVEYTTGTLKRIGVPPASTPSELIISGLVHPEDVQVDLNQGFAYVTTRDDPGTTGKLWKINLSSKTKTLVTYNLGGPQQLFLDASQNRAYTVGYNDGRLRSIDLTTGAKTSIFYSLHNPVGLAVTKDRKYAYVAEQGPPAQISMIDLATGTRTLPYVIRNGVNGISLIAPFFLAWTDYSQNALYIAEREPSNTVSRLDLLTLQKRSVGSNLQWPYRPTGVVTNNPLMPSFLYVTSETEIVRVDLNYWDLQNQPVFLGIGHVPWSSIKPDGYADTANDPGAPFAVTGAPFGGTLDIFGNLTNFKNYGASFYEVLISRDSGASYDPLNVSWNTYHWNNGTLKYDLVPIAPEPNTTRYKMPLETDGTFHPELWYPPFLFMRWTSGENGFFKFKVNIYQTINSPAMNVLNVPQNNLPLTIDNTPQTVKIDSIWQIVPPNKEIKPCDIVSSGGNQFFFKITAFDPNNNLLNYVLTAMWGDNLSDQVARDDYSPTHANPSHVWSGISNSQVPTSFWSAKNNCAHTFYLSSWKRTIDGYNYILYRDYHKSITINNLPP